MSSQNQAKKYLMAFMAGLFFAVYIPAQGGRVGSMPPVLVGFDGEYGLNNSTSAQAIELGIRCAIHEINQKGGVLGGRPIELVAKDNRSIPARGSANLKAFAAMPNLVAVFGGRFSPVILQQLNLIHELKLPLLDVWGAADGIIDHTNRPSYTFRLSLKDSWAMSVMAEHARKLGKRKIGILLPNTGWGRSNQKALDSALTENPELVLVGIEWYNWGETDMLSHYQTMLAKGADVLFLVANDIEGSLLVRQLGNSPSVERLPIISHWGVTGGNMLTASGPTLHRLYFTFVQTFSFFDARPSALAEFKATARAIAGIDRVEDIESPVGVGHAYDMMHILAKAIDKAGSTDRTAVRDALETIPLHEGLVRIYDPPFTSERHEALDPREVFLARYRRDGVILPLRNK